MCELLSIVPSVGKGFFLTLNLKDILFNLRYLKISIKLMKDLRIKSRILMPLLGVVMLAFSLNSTATVYYVDSRSGNDTETGTTVKNPWKSLAKINSQ